jgi:hypothetical protein
MIAKTHTGHRLSLQSSTRMMINILALIFLRAASAI